MRRIERKLKKKIETILTLISPQLFFRYKVKSNKKLVVYNYQIKKNPLIALDVIDISSEIADEFTKIVRLNMQHKFDLLGSGWRSYNYNDNLYSTEYREIAWNRDIKTHFVWDIESTNIFNYTNYPIGSDVKRVWELGRLQHFLRFALYALAYPKEKENILKELFKQLDDFMLNNPVGQGINWTCSMEVAIRAINLIVTMDIVRQIIGEEYKNKIVKVDNYIINHGRFITNNLEYVRHSKENHNHYFADVMGLLYIGGYYNIKKWWKFGKAEFIKESLLQFQEDGSHFEGTTAYHKLCTEMLILSTAFIIYRDRDFPQELKSIIVKSCKYLYDLTGKDGSIPQIGDNDSGRILAITPFLNLDIEIMPLTHEYKAYEQQSVCLRENTMNSLPVLFMGMPLFENFPIKKSQTIIEYSFISSMLGKYCRNNLLLFEETNVLNTIYEIPQMKYKKFLEIEGDRLIDNCSGWLLYKEVGVAIFKSTNLEIYFNIGKKNCKKFMGHIHNDFLHCDIKMNGRYLFRDPGTATYTADLMVRNEFRSYRSHFVPVHKGWLDDFAENAFYLKRKVESQIVGGTKYNILAKCKNDKIIHYREIRITDNKVIIADYSNEDFEINIPSYNLYSDNYGSICALKGQ